MLYRKFLKTIVCATALTLTTPFMAMQPAQAGTPADQLVIGMSMNNILTIDPAALTGNDAMDIVVNTYDAVVELDPVQKDKVLPGLAIAWNVSSNGRVITFNLRDGVKFQSGNPVTADDVVWSWRRVVKLNLSQASYWKSYGFSADKIDELVRSPSALTVEVELPTPIDPKLMIYTLATSAGGLVIDSKLAMEHAKDGDMGRDWLNTHTAGSGPFKLGVWRANDVLMLNRDEDYWRGEPKLKRVIMQHMTESQSLRLMLERGDIDIATGLSITDIEALKKIPHIVVDPVLKGNVYYLAMSMKDDHFSNQKVREAVRYLIDYQGINKTIMPNYGVLHQRPVQLGLAATLPEPGYKLDVERAKKLLAEAGYPDGFETTIRVLSDSPFRQIATSVQATLALGGIQAELMTGTGSQVYGAMRERKFEMLVGRGGGGAAPHPHSNLRAIAYNPDNRDEAKLTNFQGWRTSFQNDELNDLIEKASREVNDQKQKELYEKIQSLYEELVPALMPISQVVYSVVLQKDIKDYIPHPSYTTHLRDVYKER